MDAFVDMDIDLLEQDLEIDANIEADNISIIAQEEAQLFALLQEEMLDFWVEEAEHTADSFNLDTAISNWLGTFLEQIDNMPNDDSSITTDSTTKTDKVKILYTEDEVVTTGTIIRVSGGDFSGYSGGSVIAAQYNGDQPGMFDGNEITQIDEIISVGVIQRDSAGETHMAVDFTSINGRVYFRVPSDWVVTDNNGDVVSGRELSDGTTIYSDDDIDGDNRPDNYYSHLSGIRTPSGEFFVFELPMS